MHTACTRHAHAMPMPTPCPFPRHAHAVQVEELHEYVLRLPPSSDGQLIGASPLVLQMLVAIYASRQVPAKGGGGSGGGGGGGGGGGDGGSGVGDGGDGGGGASGGGGGGGDGLAASASKAAPVDSRVATPSPMPTELAEVYKAACSLLLGRIDRRERKICGAPPSR